MAWTTAGDVTGSWIGGDAPTNTALIDSWIGRAERLIKRSVPDIQTRLNAEAALVPPSTELLDTVRDVVVAMVTRVFRNPEGVRSTQDTKGPYTTSVTFGGDTPGGLVLTSDELALLLGGHGGQRVFSVDMIPRTSPYSPFYTGLA